MEQALTLTLNSRDWRQGRRYTTRDIDDNGSFCGYLMVQRIRTFGRHVYDFPAVQRRIFLEPPRFHIRNLCILARFPYEVLPYLDEQLHQRCIHYDRMVRNGDWAVSRIMVPPTPHRPR